MLQYSCSSRDEWIDKVNQIKYSFSRHLLIDRSFFFLFPTQCPIDGDGRLFRHIINYLQYGKWLLPANFDEFPLLQSEIRRFNFDQTAITALSGAELELQEAGNVRSVCSQLERCMLRMHPEKSRSPGHITVGYRGSFAFGRDGLADVKFRKLTKILVAGKVFLCREVFGETLNESRDPDHCDEENRYTARFFLKHLSIEQAFDCLHEAGFRCVGSCGSGTSTIPGNEPVKPGIDSEETRWNHYNEFVFYRS